MALPETVDDVIAIDEHARVTGLKIAVQGTGHGAAARGSLDGSLLLNMARLTGVEIDPVARTARVAAVPLWLDVVQQATECGLTGLHGSARDVGVVGYTLGGGIGWLARKHGLSASSVLAAEVVTAEGELVRASAEENGDLFWALRGGGGSFGVVTAVEIALYPVTEAFAGWLIWPIERATEVLGAWAEWTRTAPEEVTSVGRLLQIPPIPEMPEAIRGKQLVVVEAAYLGDEASGRELLRPLTDLVPTIDTFGIVPATALMELHQDPRVPSPGIGNGWLQEDFDAEAGAAVVAAAAMDGTSPLLSFEIRHLGGAVGRPDPMTEEGYTGIDIHRVARIGSAGHGRQILLSASACAPDGYAVRDLGSHRLAGLPEPEHIHQLLADGLPRDFPPLRNTIAMLGNSLRVVIAEDSVLLREGVVRLLAESGFDVVAQSDNAEELPRHVALHKPAVAIVDIRMPPTHTDEGLVAAREIRSRYPDTGVLVLSQCVEPAYVVGLLEDGAEGVGYLLKDRVADLEEFAAAVRRVGEGGSALDPAVVAQLLGRSRSDDPLAALTPRERGVLELMAEGRSNQAIAERMFVTPRAVEKHVTSIFTKLDLPASGDDHRRVLAVLAFVRD